MQKDKKSVNRKWTVGVYSTKSLLVTGSENSNAATRRPEWLTFNNHTNRLNIGLQLHKDERV